MIALATMVGLDVVPGYVTMAGQLGDPAAVRYLAGQRVPAWAMVILATRAHDNVTTGQDPLILDAPRKFRRSFFAGAGES